jgi:hypothetical protein
VLQDLVEQEEQEFDAAFKRLAPPPMPNEEKRF